jgi:hypothetical protein
MAEIVPACELQNFTPNVTALSSASTKFAGTALPKMLTGDCASDALLPEHAISRIDISNLKLRSTPPTVAFAMENRPSQTCIRVTAHDPPGIRPRLQGWAAIALLVSPCGNSMPAEIANERERSIDRLMDGHWAPSPSR